MPDSLERPLGLGKVMPRWRVDFIGKVLSALGTNGVRLCTAPRFPARTVLASGRWGLDATAFLPATCLID
jgi:hypothetical protein